MRTSCNCALGLLKRTDHSPQGNLLHKNYQGNELCHLRSKSSCKTFEVLIQMHHEYIQAGKGRDVGLNKISFFEAKVARGNGEQTLGRDIYRLGHRFDFFRMLSCYFTTTGFYVSSMMVVLTVCVPIWKTLPFIEWIGEFNHEICKVQRK
ncbi:hypothetical protein Vadar_004610 [Vaccinium darrowii]|uniref:Uncharacterized protein n=1 Tax=Vaccinium darrowii TaxID=229202 RepID=A0ACB7Y634_9ERIC|nr:hypothetical protein Vadar_004610 [Vaccinium darrowii]